MKKMILLAVMMVMTASAHAQLVTSTRVVKHGGENRNEFSINLTGGGFTGDTYDAGFGLELGLKYAYRFHPNFAWDVIKVAAITDTKHFKESMQIQGLTGIRGITPVVFGNSTIYVNAAGGYGYYTHIEEGGFAWEVGAGLNITPKFSVGIEYNSTHISYDHGSSNVGLIGARFGYTF